MAGTGDKGEDMRQARIINSYIASASGRKNVNVERMTARLTEFARLLEDDDLTPVQRLYALRDSEKIAQALETATDRTLEDDFVTIIANWSERHGITYGHLRQMNVPAGVLKRAGMSG